MLALLGGHRLCFIAEQLFLEQLPMDIQMQLANEDFSNPRPVADKADILWLAKSRSTATESSIHKVTSTPKERKHKPTDDDKHWCFSHRKFGDDMRHCKEPRTHPSAATINAINTRRKPICSTSKTPYLGDVSWLILEQRSAFSRHLDVTLATAQDLTLFWQRLTDLLSAPTVTDS